MSESKKAFQADCDVLCRTHVGGQALIEGVMMRGRYNWAVAVRQPDGSIYTEEHDLASGKEKSAWLHVPVVRGCTAFIESLGLGYKALDIASEHAYDWEEDETEEERAKRLEKEQRKLEKRAAKAGRTADEQSAFEAEAGKEESKGLGVLMTVSVVVGVLLGIAIFVIAPAALSNLVLGSENMNTAAWNIFDGVLRVAIFVVYIWLISRMKDIKRMFAYHGAEHKAIHCYEHGLELTPANAQKFPTLHVRCGTAFLIMVMLIAIFIYTVLGHSINALVALTGFTEGPVKFILVVLTRIILLPFIAGFSYEITVRWAGKRPENPLVKVILWPGMQMQRLTTNQPDDSMVECAIVAMQLVLDREELEAAKKAASEKDE